MAAELGKENGQVIATGGGAVLRAQNVRALRQNGVVVYIDRPLGQLAWEGRGPFPKVRRRWPPCMRHVRRCTPRRAMRVWKTTAPLKAWPKP